jgi:poly-gamma-glutamate synthesis protein (capsule biosynthesis protein)
VIDSVPTLTLLTGGDVGPVKQPVERLADLVQSEIATADFRFVQCERVYSNRGTFENWVSIPNGRWSKLDPEFASVFKAARADVVSVASNHALDYGYDALEDTMNLFRGWDMKVVGGGRGREEATTPVVLEKNGVTVAILAYCSVAREGQAAVGDHPGISAIRVRTWYGAPDSQPGCPPPIHSEARDEDVAAMVEDIRAAKKIADAVVVSMHWGLRYIPKVLANYEQPLAHAAIDAGADVIVGHHPHSIKAIEVYKGVPCFYSIGNYLSTGGHGKVAHAEWNLFWVDVDPTSLYNFPPYCREMMMPKLTFTTEGLARASVLPGYINDLAQPRFLSADDELFGPTLEKLEWVSSEVPHHFSVEGNEVVITSS